MNALAWITLAFFVAYWLGYFTASVLHSRRVRPIHHSGTLKHALSNEQAREIARQAEDGIVSTSEIADLADSIVLLRYELGLLQ